MFGTQIYALVSHYANFLPIFSTLYTQIRFINGRNAFLLFVASVLFSLDRYRFYVFRIRDYILLGAFRMLSRIYPCICAQMSYLSFSFVAFS